MREKTDVSKEDTLLSFETEFLGLSLKIELIFQAFVTVP